ncbi:MAG TPA: hypothetical protein VMZ53_33700 [Kofleriaceae bacterium]|nr:hypothetical protein [Kofleriaceae bacterium]
MLHAARFGRALPEPPLAFEPQPEADTADDLACAATPRSPEAIQRLARCILTGTMRTKYWIAWAGVAIGLWVLGTAVALVITKLVPAWGSTPILALGFGGLGGGLALGALWIRKRRREAQTIAREGQLFTGSVTYRRAQESFGGELSEMLALPLGETYYCIVFAIGFIAHEVWVALPSPPAEGEHHHVLVQSGARLALAFDAHGHGHVGELRRL